MDLEIGDEAKKIQIFFGFDRVRFLSHQHEPRHTSWALSWAHIVLPIFRFGLSIVTCQTNFDRDSMNTLGYSLSTLDVTNKTLRLRS